MKDTLDMYFLRNLKSAYHAHLQFIRGILKKPHTVFKQRRFMLFSITRTTTWYSEILKLEIEQLEETWI